MKSHYNKSLVFGFMWSIIGQGGYLGVSLVTNLILARMLTPYQFGQVGILMFFIALGKVLTESGLSGALIRRKVPNDAEYSTVFTFNVIFSVIFFIVLFLLSNPIASFYNDYEIRNFLRVLSFSIVISSFQFIPNTKLIVNLNFKRKSLYYFVSILISSIIGIIMAYYNYGVWSIIGIQLCNSLLLTILLWVFEKSKVDFYFSFTVFKKLYAFGVNTTASSLLNSFFDNIYQIVLGKFFSMSQTGFFYQAKRIQEMPLSILNSVTQGVVFSALSRIQDNELQFKNTYSKIITIFTISSCFIVIIIFVYSDLIINLLLGDQWVNSAFYLRVLIISLYFYLQEMFNRILFKVYNRTDRLLQLEIGKKLLQSSTILLGIFYENIHFLVLGILFTSIISYFLNFYYSRKIVDFLSFSEVIISIKVFVIGFIIVIGCYFIDYYVSYNLYHFIIGVPIIFLIYYYLLKITMVSDILTDFRQIAKLIRN